jgi:outer membrane protein insertion porin family
VEVNELFPYRFEELPAADDALRAALRKVEPIFEDRIPATAAILDRYSKAIEQVIAASGGAGLAVAGKLNADLPGGLAVLFRPSSPRSQIAEVRFTGNDAVPTTLLLKNLSPVAVGIPFTETSVRQRLEASVRPLYEARGRIRVSFPSIATERDPKVDGLVVVVSVNEGPVYNLGAVRFSGVASGDIASIEKLADLKAGDVVNFDDVKAALDRVHKRYRNSGYLRVASTVNRDIHDDSHTVDLAVALELGPQYRFGKLTISGLDIISEPAIRKMWGALEGKTFNPEFPDSFLARVREEGILDNLGNTRAETHIDEASKTVDVALYFKGAAPQPANRRPDTAPVFEPPPIW